MFIWFIYHRDYYELQTPNNHKAIEKDPKHTESNNSHEEETNDHRNSWKRPNPVRNWQWCKTNTQRHKRAPLSPSLAVLWPFINNDVSSLGETVPLPWALVLERFTPTAELYRLWSWSAPSSRFFVWNDSSVNSPSNITEGHALNEPTDTSSLAQSWITYLLLAECCDLCLKFVELLLQICILTKNKCHEKNVWKVWSFRGADKK